MKSKKVKKQKYPSGGKTAGMPPDDGWGIMDTIEPEDILDLHGLEIPEAGAEVYAFLDQARCRGFLKIRVITGSGVHSPGGAPVLKPAVMKILAEMGYRHKEADFRHGGGGALDILMD
jgi:DNA-nicking Smr family endonuclease